MREYVEYAISATSLVALLSNVRMIHRSAGARQDFGGWLALVLVILGGLLYEARFLPTGQPTQLIFFGLLLGLLVFAATRTARRYEAPRRPLDMRVLLPAGIAGAMFLSNAFMNIELPLGQSFGRLLAVAILAVLAVIVAIGRLALIDTCRIVVTSVLFILVISPIGGDNWRECDIFKCGPFGAIYTGPFSSENALAIFACVAALCLGRMWSRGNGLISLLPILLVLYATESRTSQLALVCAFAAWILSATWSGFSKRSRELNDKKAISRMQPLVFSIINFGIFVLGFILVLTAEPASFSNRGNIWIRGMGALGENWVTGLGLDRWTFLQTIGLLPPLFPHSQYLLILFGGGIVAVVLMLVFFNSAMNSSLRSSEQFYFAVGYSVFLSILGLTEAFWNPIAFDGHTMLVVPLMFLFLNNELQNEFTAPIERSGRLRSKEIDARPPSVSRIPKSLYKAETRNGDRRSVGRRARRA